MTAPTFDAPKGKRLSRNKKIGLFGLAAVGGVIIFVLYRRHAANTATSTTDTTGTDTSGIDPNTGQPYSSQAYYDPTTGQYYGLGAGGVTSGILPGTQYATNNATWAQASEGYLTNQGFDPATVATALGLYLAGLPLTADQYNIVQAAIGAEGQPPNGAPPPQQIGGGGSGQTPPPVTVPPVVKPPVTSVPKVAVPNIVGMRQIAAGVAVRSKGLRFAPQKTGTAIATTSWIVRSQSPTAGTKVNLGSTVRAQEEPAPFKIPVKR